MSVPRRAPSPLFATSVRPQAQPCPSLCELSLGAVEVTSAHHRSPTGNLKPAFHALGIHLTQASALHPRSWSCDLPRIATVAECSLQPFRSLAQRGPNHHLALHLPHRLLRPRPRSRCLPHSAVCCCCCQQRPRTAGSRCWTTCCPLPGRVHKRVRPRGLALPEAALSAAPVVGRPQGKRGTLNMLFPICKNCTSGPTTPCTWCQPACRTS